MRCIAFLTVVVPQDNLEVRIDELETVNQKLQRRRCDTVSTFSSLSLSRCSSFRLVQSFDNPLPERILYMNFNS